MATLTSGWVERVHASRTANRIGACKKLSGDVTCALNRPDQAMSVVEPRGTVRDYAGHASATLQSPESHQLAV